jgi:TolB-like protein/Flp pilus assembly protein TadD
MLDAGATLGPYKIAALLGVGGMGEVYRASDPRLGRDVAIKVLSSHLAARPEIRARFEREARTISQLSHPSICTLFDIGRAPGEAGSDGMDYLVMELLEGETLARRLERGALPVPEVFALGGQIAQALDCAHRAGVVHRDLKPANVMLTRTGAKLMDFGLARAPGLAPAAEALSQSPTVSQPLTAEGTLVGTFQYMAPEQLEGREADARSDLWALGCVLYEMATGQRAFAGTSQASLIASIMTGQPRVMSALLPTTPPALERTVRRCLEKDPDARFQSASDLAFDLRGMSESGSAAAPLAAAPRPAAGGARRPRRRLAVAGLVAAAAVAAVAAGLWGTRLGRERPSGHAPAPAPVHARTEVAVLPFHNLSTGGPYDYFAGGLHDELLTQLAKVAALKVISRTSVMGYSATTKPLRQIAGELGVGSIVEGTVQVAGNRLRVNVQLIDAATDEHLWAERYDRTLDDAFTIQSEVAQRIVAEVGAMLGSEERRGITDMPTANPEAYRLYLQGEEYRRRPGDLEQDFQSARRLYERALEMDAGFALAHAALSQVHGELYWQGYDRSPARLARQHREAEAALRLAPGLPDAHLAMGLAHYWGRRDYRRGLAEFRTALRARPNDAELWAYVGYVQRRLGDWAAADSAYRRATQLDPRNADLEADLGAGTFDVTHRYPEVVRALERAQALSPDFADALRARAWTYIVWKGELDSLRNLLGAMAPDEDLGSHGRAAAWHARLLLMERQPERLLALLRGAPEEAFAAQDFLVPRALYAAWAHTLGRDQAAARTAFGSALRTLDSLRAVRPDDWRVHSSRGLALAGLGRRGEALREAQWLRSSVVYRDDHQTGPILRENRALILAQAGEAEAALEEIESLLAGPSYLSAHLLRLDPRWDPIRGHARFQALLVTYADPEARGPLATRA